MRLIDGDALRECYTDLDDNLKVPVAICKANIDSMPTIEAEPTYEQIVDYCKERDLTIIPKDTLRKLQAEPVRHGRWLIGVGENGEPIGTYCSECGWSWEQNIVVIQLNKVFSRIETPRCPNCGARMNEVEE